MKDARVRKSDRFRALSDIETNVLIQWRAPLTSGAPCVIPVGTVLVADHDQRQGYPGFGCVPEEYALLLPSVVPEEDRKNEKFAGYYFVLLSEDIGTKLELVEPE
jgi:hypothetical protein